MLREGKRGVGGRGLEAGKRGAVLVHRVTRPCDADGEVNGSANLALARLPRITGGAERPVLDLDVELDCAGAHSKRLGSGGSDGAGLEEHKGGDSERRSVVHKRGVEADGLGGDAGHRGLDGVRECEVRARKRLETVKVVEEV